MSLLACHAVKRRLPRVTVSRNLYLNAVRFLQGLLPGWNKEALNFTNFQEAVANAVERAKRLGEPPGANPSTGVWRLIESLHAPHEPET